MALTFFWRCEGTTLDGTHDYSAGDTTATTTGNGNAVCNNDTVRVGTNSADSIDTNSGFVFDVSSDIYTTAGSMGCWFYIETWAAGNVLTLTDSAGFNEYVAIATTGTSGSGNLRVLSETSGSGQQNLDTAGANLASGNWYFGVAKWDKQGALDSSIAVEVYDTNMALIASNENTAADGAKIPVQVDVDRFLVPPESAGSFIIHVDNIFVANTYDEPIQYNALITSYTSYVSEFIAADPADIATSWNPATASASVVIPRDVVAGETVVLGIRIANNASATVSSVSDPQNGSWSNSDGPNQHSNNTGLRTWYYYLNNSLALTGTTNRTITVTLSTSVDTVLVVGLLSHSGGALTFDEFATWTEIDPASVTHDSNTLTADGAGAILGFHWFADAGADPSADGSYETRLFYDSGGRSAIFFEPYSGSGTKGLEITVASSQLGVVDLAGFLEPAGSAVAPLAVNHLLRQMAG